MSVRKLTRSHFTRLETLESRRCLSSVGWDGSGQGGADLTYYLESPPSYLDPDVYEAALESALDAWSEVADITFTQTDRPNAPNSLDIGFDWIDGAGGTLAQAYLPDDVNPSRLAGDITFDASEKWEVGNRQGGAAFDLTMVAVHEIGHALGLEHDESHSSVMTSSVSPYAQFERLASSDVDEILELYAPAVTTDDPGSPSNDDLAYSANPTSNVNLANPGLGGSAVPNEVPNAGSDSNSNPTNQPTGRWRGWWISSFDRNHTGIVWIWNSSPRVWWVNIPSITLTSRINGRLNSPIDGSQYNDSSFDLSNRWHNDVQMVPRIPWGTTFRFYSTS